LDVDILTVGNLDVDKRSSRQQNRSNENFLMPLFISGCRRGPNRIIPNSVFSIKMDRGQGDLGQMLRFFKNFRQKNSEKIGVVDSKQS
jgi:hypothetical protein